MCFGCADVLLCPLARLTIEAIYQCMLNDTAIYKNLPTQLQGMKRVVQQVTVVKIEGCRFFSALLLLLPS